MNQKLRKKTLNMYDVNSYTEEEIINNVLDLNSPTDRELEHKILSLYNRYQIIDTKEGKALAQFFKDIYDRFFEDDEDDDEDQGYESEDLDHEDYSNNEYSDETKITEGLEGNKSSSTTKNPNTNVSQGKTAPPTTAENPNSQITFNKPTDYAQDRLNPTIKETIKRIVSVDSQYRDDKRSMSTNFTFSLSEQLKDVVSLKLYSIQIPQTWYTVPKSYGCNFFYLQGNSRGIDNGYHDYTIDISAGNYTAPNLIAALNTKIQQLTKTNPDVSFGNTNIGYNPNAALATLTMSISNIYNESGYYLNFPYWTDSLNGDGVAVIPSTKSPRFQSIPGFLGFNYKNYYLNTIRGYPYLSLSTSTNGDDATSNVYYVDATNNYITVYKYIGPEEFSQNSVIDLSFNVYFSDTISGATNRTQLVNDLSYQLSINKYLVESTIKRVDITDTSLNNYGKSFFQIQLNFNRTTTNNSINSKTYIQFPTETTTPQNLQKTWTGANSCFGFQNQSYELNNITSENFTIVQSSGIYTIKTSPYIYLSCVKPRYNVIQNNYKVTVPNSGGGGYSLTQYIAAINTGIQNTNNTTINTKNTLGDFKLKNFAASLNENNIFNLGVDITKTFTHDMYYLDVTGTMLKQLLRFDGNYLNGIKDLSGSTYTFSSSFPDTIYYPIFSDYLLKAYPSRLNYGNQLDPSFVILSSGTGTAFNTFPEIEFFINNQFNTFTDPDGAKIFQGSNIVMTPNDETKNIDCLLTIVMSKSISQKDYAISFVDASSSWDYNLNLDSKYFATTVSDQGIADNSFNLGSINTNNLSYTDVSANSEVLVNKIYFREGINNFFYVKPWQEGVATGPPYYSNDNYANDIVFTIPAKDANNNQIGYTRDNLIQTMNRILNAQKITAGSSISLINTNSPINQYAKLRFNVNKIYSASDYKIVFYDQLSFNKCTPGAQYIQNTTWDTTIGWLIGFHVNTQFNLSDYGKPGETIQIVGDTTVSVNLFDYFLLCVDDFNQNHLNDGMVTVASAQRSFALPSYANKANYVCDPTTGLLTYNGTAVNTVDFNRLTQKQLYTLTELSNSKKISSIITSTPNVNGKSYGSGPYAEDVFGFIPMKTAGLAPGAVYVDYGGTLQNQERSYFGPVNIYKLGIKLISNRGDVIDLNGSDWSFSFLVEQLYQQKPTIDKKKK